MFYLSSPTVYPQSNAPLTDDEKERLAQLKKCQIAGVVLMMMAFLILIGAVIVMQQIGCFSAQWVCVYNSCSYYYCNLSPSAWALIIIGGILKMIAIFLLYNARRRRIALLLSRRVLVQVQQQQQPTAQTGYA